MADPDPNSAADRGQMTALEALYPAYGLLAGAGLPLLFWVTPGWGPSWGFPNSFWWMLGSSLRYIPFVSCFNLTFERLGNELTPDSHERTALVLWRFPLTQKKMADIRAQLEARRGRV